MRRTAGVGSRPAKKGARGPTEKTWRESPKESFIDVGDDSEGRFWSKGVGQKATIGRGEQMRLRRPTGDWMSGKS